MNPAALRRRARPQGETGRRWRSVSIPRRATKPTFGSKQRRLEGKKRRSDVKAKRNTARFDD